MRAALIIVLLTGCGAASPGKRGDTQQASPELEAFLRSYFATWSEGDMRAYKEHFHPKATILLVRKGVVKSSLPRDSFVMLQAASRARAKVKPVERMTSFTADEDELAATVVAEWELVRDGGGAGGERDDAKKVTRGIDRFTLMRGERGEWRIVALVFYSTD